MDAVTINELVSIKIALWRFFYKMKGVECREKEKKQNHERSCLLMKSLSQSLRYAGS